MNIGRKALEAMHFTKTAMVDSAKNAFQHDIGRAYPASSMDEKMRRAEEVVLKQKLYEQIEHAKREQAAAGMSAPPDPNEIPAYSMALKDLLTMFEAKSNGKWLRRSELNRDEFWSAGLQRLKTNELLEHSHDGYWVRVKETV